MAGLRLVIASCLPPLWPGVAWPLWRPWQTNRLGWGCGSSSLALEAWAAGVLQRPRGQMPWGPPGSQPPMRREAAGGAAPTTIISAATLTALLVPWLRVLRGAAEVEAIISGQPRKPMRPPMLNHMGVRADEVTIAIATPITVVMVPATPRAADLPRLGIRVYPVLQGCW